MAANVLATAFLPAVGRTLGASMEAAEASQRIVYTVCCGLGF